MLNKYIMPIKNIKVALDLDKVPAVQIPITLWAVEELIIVSFLALKTQLEIGNHLVVITNQRGKLSRSEPLQKFHQKTSKNFWNFESGNHLKMYQINMVHKDRIIQVQTQIKIRITGQMSTQDIPSAKALLVSPQG